MPKRIVLISCSARKLTAPAAAQCLYTSPLFTKSLAYAHQLRPDSIYILSALHDLVSLTQIIAPYNVTLTYVARDQRPLGLIILSMEQKAVWTERVLGRLNQVANLAEDRFILLAGKEYTASLVPFLVHHDLPLGTWKFGQRLSFLNSQIQIRDTSANKDP